MRELAKIDAADYMLSICGNEGLQELPSPGKSGSVFYLSHDQQYMVKTLRTKEVKVTRTFTVFNKSKLVSQGSLHLKSFLYRILLAGALEDAPKVL